MRSIQIFVRRCSVVFVVAAVAALVEPPRSVARASTETSKKAPRVLPPKKETISECTLAAYRALEGELPSLRALHAGDDKGLARAYALRKKELVGVAALAKRGCAPARIAP